MSKEEFLECADDMADRIIAQSSLFRFMISNDSSTKFQNMGKTVNRLINESEDIEELASLVDRISIVSDLFRVAQKVEETLKYPL